MWANKKNNTGFTIVETLIALAVSGAIFVSAAGLISGQVARNQARQATSSLEIYARDVLNDVATGYYPESTTNYTCTRGATAPVVSVGGTGRGSNSECVLAGKRITFTANQMIIDTMVANADPTSTNTITNPLTQLTPVTASQEIVEYPYSARRSGANKEYFVLNRLLSPSVAQETSFVGGGQGVSVVNPANSVAAATGFILCFNNGMNTTQLAIGANNSTNVIATQGTAACVES